jgi:hypothetical protein
MAKQAYDFIAAASSHPGESIGTILGEITRRRRQKVEAGEDLAYLTLLNIGVRASKIPDLMPPAFTYALVVPAEPYFYLSPFVQLDSRVFGRSAVDTAFYNGRRAPTSSGRPKRGLGTRAGKNPRH